MKSIPATLKLHVTISGLFLLLIVPLFSGLIFVTYQSNIKLAKREAAKAMERAREETIRNINSFVEPIADAVRSTAQLASIEPGFFRKDESGQMLLRAIQNNPDITSYYLGFMDGSFRQVGGIDPKRPMIEHKIPADARYTNRMIDRSKAGIANDSYTFLKEWGQPVGSSSIPAVYDPRTARFFEAAVKRGPAADTNQILLSDPYNIRSTGEPGLSISASIISGGKLLGAAAANLRLKRFSEFLAANRASDASITLIIDRGGLVVAHPDFAQAYRKDETKSQKNIRELDNPAITRAAVERAERKSDNFYFTEGGEEYIALFSPFPENLRKPWEVVILTPVKDFVGEIDANNRNITLFGGGLLLFVILLAYLVSKRISRPLEVLVEEIKRVFSFQISPNLVLSSKVAEISLLIDATQKLKAAISAFAAYVPRELVSDLIRTGTPLAPGGQSRYLTMFFTDLKGFSSLAEVTPTRELLETVSAYLELVTLAVKEEQGTIDKFIGDAVMAFWGAPVTISDHSYRACVAAVRSQRRMAKLNAVLGETGKGPLTVRIGIHSDQVLVGNIGSLERLSYTVMGDGVNIASRLEGINKDFGTSICVSNAVFKESGERLWLRPIDLVAVKGRKGEFLIYELLGIRDADEEVAATSTEKALCAATEKAYALYSDGQWEQAEVAYQEIVKEYDDALARVMVGRCGVHAVGRAALFDGLDEHELEYLYTILTREDLERGSLIFSEGEPGDRLFVIVKGEVSIKLKIPGTQRARRLATLGPGMAFGEMALVESKPRSADAYAKRDVALYSMSPEQLGDLQKQQPAIALKIMTNITRQLAARLRISGAEDARDQGAK